MTLFDKIQPIYGKTKLVLAYGTYCSYDLIQKNLQCLYDILDYTSQMTEQYTGTVEQNDFLVRVVRKATFINYLISLAKKNDYLQ